MSRRVAFVAVGLALAAPGPAQSSAPLTVAERLERSVVMLCHTKPDLANAVGTGFLVANDGTVMTADHVIFDEAAGSVYPRIFAFHFTGDKHRYFRLEVVHRFREGSKGRDLALLRPTEAPDTGLESLKLRDSARVGEEVAIAGFPLVFDKVYSFPLVRRGAIASARYTYEGHRILVLDLQSVPGYSGSPVLDLTTGVVVGVIRGPSARTSGTDFTVATVVGEEDLQILKQDP